MTTTTRDRRAMSVAAIGTALVSVVRIVQLALLDIHKLVLPPNLTVTVEGQHLSNSNTSTSTSNNVYLNTPFLEGLQDFIATFESEVNHHHHHRCPATTTTVPPPPASVLMSSRLAVEAQYVRRAVAAWIGGIEKDISKYCGEVLGQLGQGGGGGGSDDHDWEGEGAGTGAAAVARLQQQVWRACCYPFVSALPSELNNIRTGLGFYTPSCWESACASLLRDDTKRRREKDKSAAPTASGNVPTESCSSLLWLSVFRSPFVQQVERLLGFSRKAVFQNVSRFVLDALAAGGLSVTVDTMNKCPQVKFNKQASGIGLIPSPAIFQRAESIRRELERRMREMVDDVVLSTTSDGGIDSDPQASFSLTRAARIQSCVLIGQVLVFLRSIAMVLAPKTNSSHLCSTSSHKKLMMTMSEEQCSVLYGLNLISRVCWLLQVRGRFLDDTLDLPTKEGEAAMESRSKMLQANSNSQYVSEEQLRSAFEIVDTDGDGILSFQEATEALQAVAVGDDFSTVESALASNMVISPSGSTFSFSEFALLNSALLASDQLHPRCYVETALKALSSQCLQDWSDCLLLGDGPVMSSFRPELFVHFGVPVQTTKGDTTTTLPLPSLFKRNWRMLSLQLDGDGDDEESLPSSSSSSNSMEAPVKISPVLKDLLLAAKSVWTTSFVSVDTSQSLSPLLADNSHDSHIPFCEASELQFLKTLADVVGSVYTELLLRSIDTKKSSFAAAPSPSPSFDNRHLGPVSSSSIEEMALQAVLDLDTFSFVDAYLQHSPRDSSSSSFSCAREAWLDRVDAVDHQLIADKVAALAEQDLSRSRYLLPCLDRKVKETVTATPTATTVKDESTPNTNSSASSSATNVVLVAVDVSRFSLLPLPFGMQSSGSMSNRNNNNTNIPFDTDNINPKRGSVSANSSMERVLQLPSGVEGGVGGGTSGSRNVLGLGLGFGAIGISGGLEGIRSNLSGLGGSLGLSSFLQTSSSLTTTSQQQS
eukprot:gene4930-9831_t